MVDGVMQQVDRAADLDQAADAMAGHVRRAGGPLRVGVGLSDAGTLPLVVALEDRLRDLAQVAELVRYRIGPSVGAHTGPGTVGAMFAPMPA
jgi:fatty acid-binding protein DegV